VILGIDEAGRGPVLGPLVVAAVALRPQRAGALTRLGVCDSKEFGVGPPAVARRAELAAHIRRLADSVGVEVFGHEEVDGYASRGRLNELERRAARKLFSSAVQVKRIVCAQDQGVIVSPDGSRQQIEGSITMGLVYALTEEVHFKNGEVLDRNFDTYRIPRFSWLPQIETVLVENPAVPASGCGEPPIVNMGAVLANAIYDAAGARLRQLPMTPERIVAALKRA
jgi:hypothetical protein